MFTSLPAHSARRSLPARQSGLTLVELIVAIVVIAVGVAGVMLAFNNAVRSSADPMLAKQALAIAEALLEEVQLAPFTFCDPDDPAAEEADAPGDCTIPVTSAADARPFDNVNDYNGPLNNGFILNPIADVSGVPVPGLGGYSAAISVAPTALGPITAATGDAVLITVTVTAPDGQAYALEGYRTRYAPNDLP